jgi:hypothetical protein
LFVEGDETGRVGFVWPKEARIQPNRTSARHADPIQEELKSFQDTLEKIIKQVKADDFEKLSGTYDKLARLEAWHRNTSMQVFVFVVVFCSSAQLDR